MPRSTDEGVQRRHDPDRSAEIAEYVRHGFPWSTLSKQKRVSGEFNDLKKPGWLPTGIVVNVLGGDDVRLGQPVHAQDCMKFVDGPDVDSLLYPAQFDDDWKPRKQPPIEIIDGQHRLWSFDVGDSDLNDFEVPVVAFYGLDIGWQAYLFYTINIKPKRINTSLAYDLYPLLRGADWLERAEEHVVYQETRAQELVEILWSYPESPWHDRIDMLGEHGRRFVTQAAWIRALIAASIKPYEGRRRIGGLFGADDSDAALGWSRGQQAAFLIYTWIALRDAVSQSTEDWAEALRADGEPADSDPAFFGDSTLLNTDQGIRGVLRVANDLCYLKAASLRLHHWRTDALRGEMSSVAVEVALDEIQQEPVGGFLREVAEGLASWDWRTSKAPGLTDLQAQLQSRFRGSAGYKQMRLALLEHLRDRAKGDVRDAAIEALALEN